jgi:hypothetical protein
VRDRTARLVIAHVTIAAVVIVVALGVPTHVDAKDRFDVEPGPFVGVRIGVRWWPAGGP